MGLAIFVGVHAMRFKLMLSIVLGLTSLASAKEHKHYQSGKLLKMDSVPCGTAEKQGTLCPEYVLQSDKVMYRIRPHDAKHPPLLPIGEYARFRLQKDKMHLRVGDLEDKEREYIVVSMSPRSDSSTADATPTRLNHLQ